MVKCPRCDLELTVCNFKKLIYNYISDIKDCRCIYTFDNSLMAVSSKSTDACIIKFHNNTISVMRKKLSESPRTLTSLEYCDPLMFNKLDSYFYYILFDGERPADMFSEFTTQQ